MTRWTLLATGLTLAACSGSGSDLCSSGLNASARITNEVSTCTGSTMINSTETSAAILACQQEITSCSSQDQTALNSAVSCLNNLPPIQCSWYADGGASIPDGGAAQWAAQAKACKPTVSSACQVTFSTTD